MSIKLRYAVMEDSMAYKELPRAEKLKEAVKDVWVTAITQEYCKSLVFTISRRTQAVIDRNGHTKC